MLDQMIIAIMSGKVGWIIGGAIGLVMAMFALYYITFAVIMIGGTACSIVKILAENYGLRKAAADNAYAPEWNGMELGVTMPDGGEPVAEKKKEKEN